MRKEPFACYTYFINFFLLLKKRKEKIWQGLDLHPRSSNPQPIAIGLKNFLEPAMFCHLAVLI